MQRFAAARVPWSRWESDTHNTRDILHVEVSHVE